MTKFFYDSVNEEMIVLGESDNGYSVHTACFVGEVEDPEPEEESEPKPKKGKKKYKKRGGKKVDSLDEPIGEVPTGNEKKGFRLMPETIQKIKDRLADEIPVSDICEEIGCSAPTVYQIKKKMNDQYA